MIIRFTCLRRCFIQTTHRSHSSTSITFTPLNFWYHTSRFVFPSLTWRRRVKGKVVYLTFDDGPDPEVTPWVMQELDASDAKATFFTVGDNAKKYPEIITELRERGHHVANHTYNHLKGWTTSKKRYLQNVEQCAEVIGEKTLFRPPYGQLDWRMIPNLTKEYEVIMWDVLAKDYLKNLNIQRALQRMKKQTRSGSIVVFHDSKKMEPNLRQLLPQYLGFLKSNGYKMEVL